MKQIISIIIILFFASNFINSDELTDVLKDSKGKLANVYLIYYSPIYNASNSSTTRPFRGIIDNVTDKYLILIIGKGDNVSNPYGEDIPGKVYIRIEQIAAIKIATEEIKKK